MAATLFSKIRVCLLTMLLFLVTGLFPARAAVVVLSLDFGSATSPVASGYTQVAGNFLSNTTTASASNINGSAYSFSINNVGVFSFDDANNPLTTDGFYTFSNDALNHNFSISGLSAGDQVSLYATAAWDGNGRGAQVIFGGSTTQAQTVGTPGTSPTLANFTLIGTDIAGGSGILSGSINGAGYPATPASEGQVGGFIIQITTVAVPEPGTYLLLGAGLAMMVFLRKGSRPRAKPNVG